MKPYNITYDFSGRVALVTASSKGIGYGIAEELLRAGARVSICGRNEATLREASAQLSALGQDRLLALAGDIKDPAFLRELVAETEGKFGKIDTLVNNSGGPPPSELTKLSESQWQDALNGNLLSFVRLSSTLAPGMAERGFGRILNLTSTLAKEPGKGMGLSNTTRAAVAAFTKTLALELGQRGVTANTVLTGGVLTDRLNNLFRAELAPGENLEKAVAEAAKGLPVGSFATPTEFAKIALFLLTREAFYVTGQALAIDGGALKGVF
jgi:3-oxoacyl-[acyl-carrier protein] reductase